MNKIKMIHRVFLYGTLKQGEKNNHLLQNADNGFAKYICRAVTPERFPCVLGTRYNIPFMLNRPRTGPYILGEMFEVDDKMLKTLDELEGIAGGYYSREKMVFNLFQHGKYEAFYYVLNKFPESMLNLPMVDEYKDTLEKPYVAPNLRKDGPATELLWIDHKSSSL